MNDEEYMARALSLAEKGRGFTSPNPVVGAVLVKNDTVVGEGWHRRAGLAHAEAEAIEKAGSQTEGSTLYVTLEPCNHKGKTPPCTHAIIKAGIKRVVIGCKDPNPYVGGGGRGVLEKNGIAVVTGVKKREAETLIEDFIWYCQNGKKPFVTVKFASTLDGMIATSTGDSKWITNQKSREYVHWLRHAADAILIGSGTVKSDDPSLTARIKGVDTKDPVRVILDTDFTIDKDANILNLNSDAPTIIVTSDEINWEKSDAIRNIGVSHWIVPKKGGKLDLDVLMKKLGSAGVLNLFVEGGGETIRSFINAGIVNKVLCFKAPKFLAGNDGVPVCRGRGVLYMKDAFKLDSVDVIRFDDDILIKGYIIN